MLIEEIKNIKSGKNEVCRFGISLGIALCLLGVVFFIRGKSYHYYFFIPAVVFIFLGLTVPVVLRPIYKVWMALATIIGWLLANLILILLFYFVLTPIGFVSKLFGEDFLKIKFDKDKDIGSYWIPRKQVKFERSNYERQF